MREGYIGRVPLLLLLLQPLLSDYGSHPNLELRRLQENESQAGNTDLPEEVP